MVGRIREPRNGANESCLDRSSCMGAIRIRRTRSEATKGAEESSVMTDAKQMQCGGCGCVDFRLYTADAFA
jgi:hypothetical protein